MDGNNTKDEIVNNHIINTTQDTVNHETIDSQQQIPVNNNELVIYQDVDGEYKTFMLSPEQMAELELLVQTPPSSQTVPSQCRVVETVQNAPPDIVNSSLQLMASPFQPITLSQVNAFTPSNEDTKSDLTSPQYISNKPETFQTLLYRNTNPAVSITEPYFSNQLLLPGTVLLNNEENLNNILKIGNAMNIVNGDVAQNINGEDKPKDVVSSTSSNTTKEISGIPQAGQVIEKTADSNIVNDVIGNINVPITLQANGNLLPVRIANGNIAKITKSAASHTTVYLLKTGQSFHSMEQLDSEKLKAVATAVNSVGNVVINKNYSMFDPATKTRIIYRLVYPEDLKLNNNVKVKKTGRRPKAQTDHSATQSTVPQQVKVTSSGRTVRLPRHMGDTIQGPLASSTSPLPRKRLLIFPCPTCSKHFRGQKRLEQHYKIQPEHRPPEVIKCKPVNLQPATRKLVNLQPANLKPVSLQPTNPQPTNPLTVNPQPANPPTVNSQPANTQPTRLQPANQQNTNTQPTNTQPVNPQPANIHPVNSQPANIHPANPQPANTHPVNPQPVNTQPVNTQHVNSQPANIQSVNPQTAKSQSAQEPESPADKNLNLFECLINILDKTTKENRAMVFVQQLETLLVRLRSLMPCMIGARVRRHGSLCSINKELGRVFDVTAGNYTLDMDALKCTKDMDGTCHHLLPDIIVDDLSDDCIDADTPEVPCSRTHSVQDWPLSNKRVWNTRAKINSTTPHNGRNAQNGLSDVRNKVRTDDILKYSSETNRLLNVTEKERSSWPTIMEEVTADMSVMNKMNADPEKSNTTVLGFQEMEDNMIGMLTYDSNKTTIPLTRVRSPDAIDLEQNIEANYQFHSSHLNKRSSPIKRSSGSSSKLQIKRDCFVELTEQERPFSLPDVITSVADSTNKFGVSTLRSIPLYTQAVDDHSMVSTVSNNVGSRPHASDQNSEVKVNASPIVDFPMSEESFDMSVSPTPLSKHRKSLISAQKFTLDDLRDDSVDNEISRTDAYITKMDSMDPPKSSNKTMIPHTFQNMENHLEHTDSYISKLQSPDKKRKTNKTKKSNIVEKVKRRKKIKKCMTHSEPDMDDSYLSNSHGVDSNITKITRTKSDNSQEKFVNSKLDKSDLFLADMLSPNMQLNTKETAISDSSTKGKRRKMKKKSVNKDHNPADLLHSNIHCTNEQISNNSMSSNTLDGEKRCLLDTKLGKTDPIMSSIHQTETRSRNRQLDATDLYLSSIHSSSVHMCTSENIISDTLMKEHRQRSLLDAEIDRADSYLTNIHTAHGQTRKNESNTNRLTNGKKLRKKSFNATDSIFASVHSEDVQMSDDLIDSDIDRTNSYLSNIHAPNLQLGTNEVVISDSLSKERSQRILGSSGTDSYLSSMNSPNTHISRRETITSDSCTNEDMLRSWDEKDQDMTDSYLLNVRSKHTQNSNDALITNTLTDRKLQRHMTGSNEGRSDSMYCVHPSDDLSSNLEGDRKESFLSNLHSSNAQMSSDVNIISDSLANGKTQRSLVDNDVDRAEAFLANMHSSDAQMSSNENDSMSEVKMTQNEGLLSVNESSLDSGRLSSLQLLDLSLSFTDPASSQMSLDLPLDLFPYHHP